MEETLRMLKTILNGKEKNLSEGELIKQYKEGLYPNVLAYFYCSNFGVILQTSKKYPIITEDDRASFCLQILDECLQNYDFSYDTKFITYFLKCYKNCLRTLYCEYTTNKRKILSDYEQIDELNISYCEDIHINDTNTLLNEYNLTDTEKQQCKLLNMGYTIKEIARKLNLSQIAIYKRNSIIKQKILNSNINLA